MNVERGKSMIVLRKVVKLRPFHINTVHQLRIVAQKVNQY